MATKEAYQQKWEAQLKEWDAKLDVLTAKAQKTTADVRISYENELENLRAKRTAVLQTLEALGQRSENAWVDMKDGVERVWDEMGNAMEKAAARFK